jgi:glycosyltransferase involved in cell wall biosynthesis
MNILFFYESMNLGGQQTQTYNLVKRIAAAGHEVSWVYLSGEGMQDMVRPYALLQRIPVSLQGRDYLFRPWRVWRIVRELRAFARSRGANAIISGSGLGSLICGLAARSLGILHLRLLGCSLIQVEKMLYRFYRWIRIDALIDGYFGWPAVFDELHSKGVRAGKFIDLGNAVDTNVFRPLGEQERAEVRAGLGIAPGELVIGWIGRISPDMQVGNTLALGALLQERGMHAIRLLFVGGGPWLEGFKAQCRSRGVEARSLFTDWVPVAEVNRLINAMDIVPLLEADPQGGSIVREAMACGRVALSVDGPGGTQRRFMPPGAAVLVPAVDFLAAAADACQALAADAVARERLGQNARRHAVLHMSFDAQVSIVLDTCRRLAPRTTRVTPSRH